MSSPPPPGEPIAIVGSGCRFAGDTTTPSKLWELLKNPVDLTTGVPPSRFSVDGFFHHNGEYHGTTDAKSAYWLSGDHRLFDAAFFSITPKEAEAIDPQQKMLLEVVFESLQSAGFSLSDYAGKKVAVFAGIMTSDFDTLCQRDDITASQYFATGNARSIIANRISYFYNFRGPSMTIDTACSASLVALHQAIASLRSQESTMACVAGANLMITPEQFITESSLHMLSPSGRCRMWDARADGYARGEGVASILLKSLSRALADGDNIQAIIRETGVNSDGRTQGITLPNPQAQASLIRDTYKRAGLDPTNPAHRCQYFEAHGTGTQAGDPREARAIWEAFFQNSDTGNETSSHAKQDSGRKLMVGSVKTVIGHTEGAAGLAGILKVVQSIRHGQIPPNLHMETLNPAVAPFCKNIEVPTVLSDWPEPFPGHPRRASVNSFGFGGTNGHAIVEQYTPEIHDRLVSSIPRQEASSSKERTPEVEIPLVLSANSKISFLSAVRDTREFLRTQLPKGSSVETSQFLSHMFSRRTAFPLRVSVTGSTTEELIFELDKILEKSSSSNLDGLGIRSPQPVVPGETRILGVFTGQGAQWAQMSKALLFKCATYRKTITALDEILRTCPNPPQWTLADSILADASVSRIGVAEISQPVCTAVQVALIDLLAAAGITFSAVVGHSSGEIAAAYAAGRLSARDSILLAYYRGRYAYAAGRQGSGIKGGMIAAGISRTEAEWLCSLPEWQGRLSLAANNAPTSTTISGDIDAVLEFEKFLAVKGTFARRLQVDTAYHSDHMLIPAELYTEALEQCNIKSTSGDEKTQWFSSVYGDSRVLDDQELSSTYWADNMTQAVLFQEAIQTAVREAGPFDLAIEVGPHPALKGPVTQSIQEIIDSPIPYSGVLSRKRDDTLAVADLFGFIWAHLGPSALSFGRLIGANNPVDTPQLLEKLPRYPWDHSQIHYRESRISQQHHGRKDSPHELLGVRTRDDTENQPRWRNILKIETIPWLEHHRFQGQALLPASAYCVMALDAARVVLNGRAASVVELCDLDFAGGITIEADTYGVETLFSLTVLPTKSSDTIEADFTLSSAYADGSTPMRVNFRGSMKINLDDPSADALPCRPTSFPETTPVTPTSFYEMMSALDLKYTGPFRAIKSIKRRYNFASTTLLDRHDEDTTTLRVSPATLDASFQACFSGYSSSGDKSLWTCFLPRTVARMTFNFATCDTELAAPRRETAVDAYITHFSPTTKNGAATITADMGIYDEDGHAQVQIEAMTVASFAATNPESDYELYLHTVMNIDPEDEMVGTNETDLIPFQQQLNIQESILRVVYFNQPAGPNAVQSPWPEETTATLEKFVMSSPHASILATYSELCKTLPWELADDMTPTVEHEAMALLRLQRYIAAVTRQISHKYPAMTILSVTDPSLGLNEHIIDGLQDSFLSLTTEGEDDIIFEHRVLNKATPRLKNKLATGGRVEGQKYDLVFLSVTEGEELNPNIKPESVFSVMNPGAFVVLIAAPATSLKTRLEESTGLESEEATRTLPKSFWPTVLETCGYVQGPDNADQHLYGAYSVITRQAPSFVKETFRNPFARSSATIFSHDESEFLTQRLLLVGGRTEESSLLLANVEAELIPVCETVDTIEKLDDESPEFFSSFTAVILLNDFDEPIVSGMKEARLEAFRALMRPEMSVLWVTQGARSENPEHAASFGLARTLLAEIPSLTLQMLDLETMKDAPALIIDTFARMCHRHLPAQVTEPAVLTTYEPEVYIQEGTRLIPRVLPYRPAIDRVNAPRRLITTPVNTLEKCVQIAHESGLDGKVSYEANIVDNFVFYRVDGRVTVEVLYSSVEALQLPLGNKAYLCLGRDVTLENGRAVIVLADSPASFLRVPQELVYEAPRWALQSPMLIAQLMRAFTVLAILDKASNKKVVLIEPDMELYKLAKKMFAASSSQLVVVTTKPEVHKMHPDYVFLHRHSSPRVLKGLLSGGSTVFNFGHNESRLCEGIEAATLQSRGEYFPAAALSASRTTNSTANPAEFEEVMIQVGRVVLDMMDENKSDLPPAVTHKISVPDLLALSQPVTPLQVVDWRAERTISLITPHLVAKNLLSPDKTYLLVGITRDLGQSLAYLFAEQGARHIVLASRNPPHDEYTRWRGDLYARTGCDVHMEKVDVTSLDSVRDLGHRLRDTLPPLGGVVNGAMVLEDRVFSQMTEDCWFRVLRPKTVGSRNLDSVFREKSLEFFIMTSSFAAIGGHAGQSNYAAANMFMNGLAAERRAKGLAGSVLNIGVIYGLGLLHREKNEIYRGLERDGYPPISERDIHHMFLEVIIAGKPIDGQILDLTTGLSRYHISDPEPLHWHLDPRFCHYTVKGEKEAVQVSDSGLTVREQIDMATTESEVKTAIIAGMTEKLRSMLQMSKEAAADAARFSLADLGVDSLAANELRTWVYRQVGHDISVMKILAAQSVEKLCAEIASLAVADKEEKEMPVPVTAREERRPALAVNTQIDGAVEGPVASPALSEDLFSSAVSDATSSNAEVA